jgi:hypothetical protein
MKKKTHSLSGLHAFKSNDSPIDGEVYQCIVCGVFTRWDTDPLSKIVTAEYRAPEGEWQEKRIPCHTQADLFGAR